MSLDKPRITAKIAGRPLHPLFRPFAIGYFLAVGFCDLIYSQASIFMQNESPEFSSITQWLLVAGLIMAAATAIVAFIDLLGESRFRSVPGVRMYAAGGALVLAIELQNFGIRWTDGASAITPMGLILSLSAIAVLLATPSQAWARMYR